MQSNIENAMNINDDARRKLQVSRRSFLSLMGMGAITLGLGLAGCGSTEGKGGAATTGSDEGSTVDKITMVWLPNESSAEFDKGREEFGKVLEKYAGVPVELMTTTDYNVAIEAIASGKAQLANMGAEGFIQVVIYYERILRWCLDNRWKFMFYYRES